MPDEQILALFEGARPIDTPTPGVRAWLAQDRADGQRPVLIKRVDGRAGSKGRATEALALLHPAVVRTRRWLAEDGALYVVRDVVRGKNLRHLLAGEDTPSSAASLRRLLLPAIEALEYAHAQGFAHGGVSPENVLVGDEGGVYVSDFATADPKAPQHFVHYNGTASFGGDVRALSRVLLEFLPTTGAFANAAVRERIGGIIGRCDTPADLKEAVNALERLAAAPIPRAPQQAPPPPPQPRPAALEEETGASHGTPRLTCTLSEKSARAAQGGGGAATLLVKNEGSAALVIRMIATQHPWLNVRPIDLPLTIAPGAQQGVPFAISAARLTPGEYRSEVYLSANAAGKTAEDLRGGWFKHTAEIRVTVEPNPTLQSAASPAPAGKPPYPANAPRVPAGPGCLLALPAVVLALIGHRLTRQ